MRISDWSSDVCSSDLLFSAAKPAIGAARSRSQSAANLTTKPIRGKDQSATQHENGGVSPDSWHHFESDAVESPRPRTRNVYSRATFRQYKAALLADFEARLVDQSPNITRADDEQVRSAIDVLHRPEASRDGKEGVRTSISRWWRE